MTLLRSSTAQAQKPIVRQLREFATVASEVIRFALPVEQQNLFKANTKQPNRIAPFGYYNRITHTSAMLFLGKEAQTKLHLVLLALKSPLSRDQHEAFTAERLVVKPQKFVGHHIYHGGAAITHLATKMRSELRTEQCMLAQVPDQPCSYFCPQGHPRVSNNHVCAFDVTKSIWCFGCKASHSSMGWKCSCKTTWHLCPIHFSSCMVANSAVTTAATVSRGNKRPAAATSAVSARKLARLEPSMASRLCLSPALAAKFPHLVNRELSVSGRGLSQGAQSYQAQSPTHTHPPPAHT